MDWLADNMGVVSLVAYVLIIVLSVVAVLYIVYRLYRRHLARVEAELRGVWQEGWMWCLRVHNLLEDAPDPSSVPDSREDSWRDGYLSCLDMHGLRMTDMDRDELHHNPYTTRDASQRLSNAVSSAGATVAASTYLTGEHVADRLKRS